MNPTFSRFAPAAALLLGCLPARAEPPKTYRVNGPVLDLANHVVVLPKGSDRLEAARTPEVKMEPPSDGGLKFSLSCTMTVSSVRIR